MDDSTLEYFLSIKTVQLDMVKDRGYVVPEHEKNITENINNFRFFINEIEDNTNDDYWELKGGVSIENSNINKLTKLFKDNKFHKNNNLSWQIYWNVDKTKMFLVYYINLEKDIPVEFIRFYINFIEFFRKLNNNIELSSILISNKELTPESRKNLKLAQKNQFFLENELTYNPIRHVSNQVHDLLSKEEVNELEKELKLDKAKFPGIKLNNAVVKYYGFELGDVIKITRTQRHVSILGKQSINYRTVIV